MSLIHSCEGSVLYPRDVELDDGDPSERLGDAAVPAEEQAVNEAR